MKSRKEIMLILIELNNFIIDELNKHYTIAPTKYPELTASWLDEKFDRFHIVESTRHIDENFEVQVELRYTLRSQEARKFGERHQVFYDRYLSTNKVPLTAIENPEQYKEEISKEFIISKREKR